MERKLLTIILLVLSICASAQNELSGLKKVNKLTLIEGTPLPDGFIAIDYPCNNSSTQIISFTIKGKKIKKGKLVLLDAIEGSEISCGKCEKGSYEFTLKLKNQHRDNYFQLKDGEKNIFYNMVIKILGCEIIKLDNSVKELTLPPYVFNGDPCHGCPTEGNIIEYDFQTNTLRNEKKPSADNCRVIQRDFLKKHKCVCTLPHTGETMEFVVVNVNPFKYDVTLKDEPINIHSSSSALLDTAFSLPAINKLVQDSLSDDERLVLALGYLDKALTLRISQLQRDSDCFNPCESVKQADKLIVEYFKEQLGFLDSMPLEEFLSKKITEAFKDAGDDEDALKIKKEMEGVVLKYTAFKTSAVASFRYSIPEIKNVDQYVFTLNITPKANVLASKRVINQPISVDIMGGFRADVSTGLFLTSLTDEKYTLTPVDSIPVLGSSPASYAKRRGVVKENSGKYDFGVAALFHFYKRLTTDINISFSLGAGASLSEKPKMRYLTGGSLLLGKTNRLALTYGLAMGFVEELSDRYAVMRDAQGYLYTSSADTSVDMKKRFIAKPFVSLSYSIPVFNKKEEVKAEAKEEKTEE